MVEIPVLMQFPHDSQVFFRRFAASPQQAKIGAWLGAPGRAARRPSASGRIFSFAYPAFTPRFAMLASATYRAIFSRPASGGT